MKTKVRGLQDVNVAIRSGPRSRSQTQDGILNEVAQLAQLRLEKARLVAERTNCQKRMERLDARLSQIADIETWLLKAVKEEGRTLNAQVAEGTGHIAEETRHKERSNEVILRY